ncbi:MAG: BolA family transcriptional regulator [bacterium]|nr:BolA family transcriptional regulator [bacterium]
MQDILTENLSPAVLEISNDSDKHIGHGGHDGSGESHFTIRIVSGAFEGKSRLERHRMIYDLLQRKMREAIHALSIKALSPKEYRRK